MDFEINGIPYLCMIRDFGLGKMYTKDKIKVIGEKPDHLITHFKPYRKFAKNLKKWSSEQRRFLYRLNMVRGKFAVCLLT
jgi:hypothetical protein